MLTLFVRCAAFLIVGSDEDEDEDDRPGDGGVEDENGQAPSIKRENADPVVKTEEGVEPPLSKRTRRGHKTPSNELHIYSSAELSRLNQRELLADVQLLDGLFVLYILRSVTNVRNIRASEEEQAEHGCAEGVSET
jgi:hypothetical protein